MFCSGLNDHCTPHQRPPWRPSTRKQSKTHAVFSTNIHNRSLAAALTLGWRQRWSRWSFTRGPEWENFTLPSYCLSSLVSTTTSSPGGATTYTLWMITKLHLQRVSRGYRGQYWNQLLFSSSEASTWVTSCSHPITHPNCAGPSNSGHMTEFQHLCIVVCIFSHICVSDIVCWTLCVILLSQCCVTHVYS